MKRAKLIARVSTDKQDNELKIKELRDYCKSNNIKIVGEYWIEETGTKPPEQRKKFMKAFTEDLGEDYLILNKLDRLTRNFQSIAFFEDYLQKASFDLICLDHTPNLKNSVGRLLFRQLLTFACFETEQMKERLKPKTEKRKAEGGYKGRQKGAKGKAKNSKITNS